MASLCVCRVEIINWFLTIMSRILWGQIPLEGTLLIKSVAETCAAAHSLTSPRIIRNVMGAYMHYVDSTWTTTS